MSNIANGERKTRKETTLAWFAAAAGTYLDLGLSTEQRICLYRECFSIARDDCDSTLLNFCTSSLATLHDQAMRNTKKPKKQISEEHFHNAILGSKMNAYKRLAEVHWKKEEYDEALAYSKRYLTIAQESGDKVAEMNAYNTLTNVHFEKEEYDDAVSYAEKYLAIALESGDKVAEMKAYKMLANVHFTKEEYDDAVSYGEKYLAIALESGDKVEEMKAYKMLANVHFEKEEYDDAVSYGEKYLAIALESGDKVAEMKAYITLANIHFQKKGYDDVVSYSEKYLAMALESGDKVAEMNAYNTLANIHFQKKGYDDVVSYSEKYLAIAQESGDKVAKINAYKRLAKVHFTKEEYDAAVSYGEKYLTIAQEYGDKVAEMNAYNRLANIHFKKEEYDDVVSYSEKYLAIAQESSDKVAEMNAYNTLTNVHFEKEEYDYAASYGEKYLAIALESGDKVAEMNAYNTLTNVHFKKEEYDDAVSYGEKYLAIALESGDKVAEMRTYNMLANVHCKKEEYDDAVSYGEKYLAIALESGDEVTEMRTYNNLAEVYLRKKEYDAAVSYSEKYLAMAQESGDKVAKMIAYKRLANVHFTKEEYDEAVPYSEKCLATAQESDDKVAEMNAYNMLANVHFKKEEHNDALSYSKKYLKFAQESGDKVAEMNAYNNLAEVHWKKEDYDDAVSYNEKYLAIAVESGDEVAEKIACNNLAEIHWKKEEYDEVTCYLKKYLAIALESGDKVAEMKAYNMLANAHFKKEEYDDAVSYGENYLAMAQESGDKVAEMKAYNTLANAHFKKEEYDDAVSYSRTYLAIALESGDKVAEMNAYNMLANAHFKKEEYDDAVSYGEKYLAIALESGDKVAEMNAYNRIAGAKVASEEYDEAIFYFGKCLPIAREYSHRVLEMSLYIGLGNCHLAKGNFDDAHSWFSKGLKRAMDLEDKESNTIFPTLFTGYLNMVYYFVGVLETDEFFNTLLVCLERLIMKSKETARDLDHPTPKEDIKRSNDSEGKSADVSSSSSFTSFVMSIFKLVGLTDEHQDSMNALLGLLDSATSEVQASKNHEVKSTNAFHNFLLVSKENPVLQTILDAIITFLKSNESMRQVLRFALLLLPGLCFQHEYQKVITRLEQLITVVKHFRPQVSIFCLEIIGHLYIEMENYDKGIQCYQDAIKESKHNPVLSHFSHFYLGQAYSELGQFENAEKSFKESLKCNELIYHSLNQNDRFKIAFVHEYKEAYKMLLKVLIQTNKKGEALVLSDRYRAKALKDHLDSNYGVKKLGAFGQQRLQYSDIQSLVSTSNYFILLYSTCFDKMCTFLVQEGERLILSVEHFEYCDTCLDKLVDKAFDDMKVRQVVNCEEGSLGHDDMDSSGENKNPKEDELTRMLTRQKEKRLAEQCRSICGCRGQPSENTDEISLTGGLEILYHKLIRNIKCLVKQDEIVIIPEGPLCKVPFAALQDPDTGQYLSETKRIRMAPSMATLKLLQEYPEDHHSSKEALIIGGSVTGNVMYDGAATEFVRLDGAIDEADEIAKLFGVNPLLGGMATKPEVMKRLGAGASVVHIAAHGSLEKAAIILSPATLVVQAEKIPGEEDYLLTMADVQQAQVRAQLVVLSCCYSGRGKIKAEGVVGMCRAFLASGARAVMGSLWAINDDATWVFMEKFYKYLKDGKSASTSLHLTMNDMRKTPEYSEPKYWAPFFLMGDDVTIKFED